MENERPQPSGISRTEDLDVTFGAFHLSDFRVPYMSAVLRVQQVAEYLKLVTETSSYAVQDWSLEELFQREVDQSRVHEIAGRYLNSAATRPQFFNSLTVVLTADSDVKPPYHPPEPSRVNWKNPDLGPIRVSYKKKALDGEYPAPSSFGYLSWNRNEVMAVAIDGQHRLAALKELFRRNPQAASDTTVSVLFLMFDSALGFRSPHEMEPVEAMRSIFIDLNKRAVPVTRARNLLLDDLDAHSEMVRNLVGRRLNFRQYDDQVHEGLPVGEDGEFKSRLPLAMVDWHGEQRSKIDVGPYVTSILGVDWIVKKLLSERSLPFEKIPDAFELSPDDDKYYEKLKNALKAWPETWRGGVQSRLGEAEENRRAFFLNRDEVESIGGEFLATWGRPVTRLLTRTGPYADLATHRLARRSVNGAFSQWYQAHVEEQGHRNESARVREHYRLKKEEVERQLGDHAVSIARYEEVLGRIQRDLKRDGNSIFFLLVGQRALVFSLIQLARADRCFDWAERIKTDFSPFEDCHQDFYAFYLSEAVSALHRTEPELFEKAFRVPRALPEVTEDLPTHFWAGTLVRREQPDQVDFSEKAAQRGEKWFTLMTHLYWAFRVNPTLEAEDVVLAIDDPDALGPYDLGNELFAAIQGTLGSFDRSLYYASPMSFLAGMLEDRDDEVARSALEERLRILCKATKSAAR